LAGVKWQRCQFHLAKNLLDYLPPNVSQEEASAELRGVFNAPNRAEADRLLVLMVTKYHPVAPKLAAWLEANIPNGLTVFDFPVEHRRRLRTNMASNDSTARSSAAPVWQPCSPMKTPCSASPLRCSWSSTRSGKPKSATCPQQRIAALPPA
jgi:hypothetical protein